MPLALALSSFILAVEQAGSITMVVTQDYTGKVTTLMADRSTVTGVLDEALAIAKLGIYSHELPIPANATSNDLIGCVEVEVHDDETIELGEFSHDLYDRMVTKLLTRR